MESLSIISLLSFGFVLGLKHAIDADHLAAVSTMASERASLFSSSLIGLLWGIGHTTSLMIAGVLVIFLGFQISEQISQVLEFCVGLMLVVLGLRALLKLLRGGKLHIHLHQHGGHVHAHPHVHDASPEKEMHSHHGLSFGVRPLIVGLVHGLAGSAALMLLVLARISSPVVGLFYILVFGIGSIGGMMIMSAMFAFPTRLTASRFTQANLALRGLAGLFSLSFGLLMIYRIGFLNHLFI